MGVGVGGEEKRDDSKTKVSDICSHQSSGAV